MQQNEIFLREYQRLNPQQKQAVDTIDGPVMVIAGPGTGKTQIIASRAANIILKAGVNPENIFITTFTEAGVVAIKERLLQFIGKESYKVYVSTIHSFAQDVISTFPEKFSEEKSSLAIDEVDSLEIVKEILQKLIDSGDIHELRATGQDMFYLRDIKRTIDSLKQEAIIPTNFLVHIENQRKIYNEKLEELKTNKRIRDLEKRTAKDSATYDAHIAKLGELQNIYQLYQKTLREREMYDFNDMIQFVVQKFSTDEDLRYYYAEKFQYIMLDEYQDTNNAQNEIIQHILSVSIDTPNIMVVGDDDQSIYRFQGANIENMLGFHQKFRDVTHIVLQENYRSRQQVLDAATDLIQNNSERLEGRIPNLEKKLVAKNPKYIGENAGGKIPFFLCANDIAEKMLVLENIKTQLLEGKSLSEIAIIVRNNREVESWTDFLKSQEIEVISKLKTNILHSPYVQFLLDFIALIVHPYVNEEKFINILRTHIIDIENVDIIKINRFLYSQNYSRKEKIKIFDILTDTKILATLELKSLEKIQKFLQIFDTLTQGVSTYNFVQFFDMCIRETQILEYVEKHGSFEDLQDIYTLFGVIKDFGKTRKNFSVESFLQKISLYREYNFNIERKVLVPQIHGVQVMTAHSSKGLEFETVFIPGLYSGNWDSKRNVEKIKLPIGLTGGETDSEEKEEKKDKQTQEDRRLLFVALTRAKNNLFLSSVGSIDGKIKIVSEFVEEIKTHLDFIEPQNIETPQLEEMMKKTLKGVSLLHKHSEDEMLYIAEFLKNYRLSASDLNVFLEDPREFLHRVIYKYPFQDNEATIFGSVYHSTLEYFYKDYKKSGIWWTKDQLLQKFSSLLKREILTPLEFERLEKKGIEGLSGYFDHYEANFQEPFFVEYNFRGKDVVFEGIPLTGKIDKIIRLPGTEAQLFEKEEVAVVDYKTGAIKYTGEIKGIDKDGNKLIGFEKGKYFRQLLFYKLLCENAYEFSRNFEVKKLYLDFAEGREGKYKIEDVTFTQEDFQDFQKLVTESWGKISDIEFWKEVIQ